MWQQGVLFVGCGDLCAPTTGTIAATSSLQGEGGGLSGNRFPGWSIEHAFRGTCSGAHWRVTFAQSHSETFGEQLLVCGDLQRNTRHQGTSLWCCWDHLPLCKPYATNSNQWPVGSRRLMQFAPCFPFHAPLKSVYSCEVSGGKQHIL